MRNQIRTSRSQLIRGIRSSSEANRRLWFFERGQVSQMSDYVARSFKCVHDGVFFNHHVCFEKRVHVSYHLISNFETSIWSITGICDSSCDSPYAMARDYRLPIEVAELIERFLGAPDSKHKPVVVITD